MINDLQAIARDARNQKDAAERERDAIVGRLQDAEAQLSELREKEIEFRKQFVEISSLLRERDNAQDNAARAERRASELEERLRAAGGERADAQKQRDEAVMRVAEVARQSHDNATQLADVQKQMTAIRQARDAAQSQNLELNTRIRTLEDQLSEAMDLRDDAEGEAKKASASLAEIQGRLDSTAPALDAARELVDALTAERDNAAEQVKAQTAEIEHLKKDVNVLQAQLSESQITAAELDTLHKQLTEFAAEREAQLARQKELMEETDAQQERLTHVTEQLAAVQLGHEEALTSLNAAQKQIDHIIRDRDLVRQQGIDNSLELESKIDELRAQLAAKEKAVAAAEASDRRMLSLERERDSLREKAEQSEKQRLLAVELTAQLDTARRELIRISSELGEARLAARQGQQASRAQRAAAAAAEEAAEVPMHEISIESPEESKPTAPRMAPTPLPDPEALSQALSEKDAKSTLGAIKRCYQTFTRTSDDISLLNELHCHLHYFSERARISGCVALHRLGEAAAVFAQVLYRNPDLITGSAMRTIGQTIDFLAILLKQRDYNAIKDPTKSVVYVVDDDAANCEAIRLGLEVVGLRAQTSQDPVAALNELAGGRYDLIFLDVNMPKMDGFDLCQKIRQLAIHAKTPIVFLTGMATVENRVQSSISGANDFIAKPFNLHELSVKTLTLLLKSSMSQ